jgi:hypothetical protein
MDYRLPGCLRRFVESPDQRMPDGLSVCPLVAGALRLISATKPRSVDEKGNGETLFFGRGGMCGEHLPNNEGGVRRVSMGICVCMACGQCCGSQNRAPSTKIRGESRSEDA